MWSVLLWILWRLFDVATNWIVYTTLVEKVLDAMPLIFVVGGIALDRIFEYRRNKRLDRNADVISQMHYIDPEMRRNRH